MPLPANLQHGYSDVNGGGIPSEVFDQSAEDGFDHAGGHHLPEEGEHSADTSNGCHSH